MLNADLIAQTALAAISIVAVLLLVHAVLDRRHRRHLSRLATRYSMSLIRGTCPAKYAELSGRYHGSDRKASVSDLMLGGTTDELFCCARRMGRTRQQLVCFELQGSARLERFYVFPETSKGPDGSRLTLHWSASRTQWSDEKALSMSARVMYGISSLGTRGEQPQLGVELQGRKVWIHSLRNVRGADLDRFLDDAMRLRQILRKSLERTNGMSQKSGQVRAVSGAVPVERVQPVHGRVGR